MVARIDEVLTDPAGAAQLRHLAGAFIGSDETWPELELRCRRMVADRLLAPELDRLARGFGDALHAIDGVRPPLGAARAVMAELAAELGVYRVYLPAGLERALRRATGASSPGRWPGYGSGGPTSIRPSSTPPTTC